MTFPISLMPAESCVVPRVTIVGAGKVGGSLAQRVLEGNLADVVLLDIVPEMPQAIALDLMQAQSVARGDRRVIGTHDYDETAGSQVVVITAGLPRRPGMSRDDLIATNAKIVSQVAREAIARSPDALLLIVTNPLDVMTYVAWHSTGLPPAQVMGMAGVLDSTRFRSFLAWELGISPADVNAIVLGGHGDSMVPLPRYTTVSGVPLSQCLDAAAIARIVERTRNGGAELVKLYKTGGAYLAPAASIYTMLESVLRDRRHLLPVSAYLQGEYDLKDLFLGVPVYLSSQGVEKVIQLELDPPEYEALHQSAALVKTGIHTALTLLA